MVLLSELTHTTGAPLPHREDHKTSVFSTGKHTKQRFLIMGPEMGCLVLSGFFPQSFCYAVFPRYCKRIPIWKKKKIIKITSCLSSFWTAKCFPQADVSKSCLQLMRVVHTISRTWEFCILQQPSWELPDPPGCVATSASQPNSQNREHQWLVNAFSQRDQWTIAEPK